MKAIFNIAALLTTLVAAAPVQNNGPKYIVTFKNTTNVQAHTAWVAQTFSSHLSKRGLAGIEKVFSVVPAYVGEFDDATIAALKANPDVLAVEKDAIASIAVEGNEKRALTTQNGAPYGLDGISHRAGSTGGSQYIYDNSAGAGTFAYIVDSGINTGHEQFGGRASFGYSAISGSNIDDNGHGTHVAGTVGSTSYGVAKAASLIAVKVLDAQGNGPYSGILDGIDWVIRDVKAKGRTNKAVINMSLGGGKSDAVNKACQTAHENGVVVVVAAGNQNDDAAKYSPASADYAMTVGSVGRNNVRASDSNYGYNLSLFATGVNVLSTWIGSSTATRTISGTSMASPHVAGLVLYLIRLEGLANPTAVWNRIDALTTKNRVQSAGYGSPNKLAYNGNGA